MPIIDTHMHLWDPAHFRMMWTDSDDLLNRPYTIDMYRAQTATLPIEAMVFIECGVAPQYAFLEAKWAVMCAQTEPRIQGIVAACPLEFGLHVRSYIESLLELDPHIKGVRRNVQDEQDANFCLQAGFVQGVQLLAAYQLTCDLCIRHQQLPAVTALARLCPDTQFILDHLGKPNVKAHILEPWRTQIQELAALPNVVCKISGLVTEADPSTWRPEDLAPYISHVLATFGEDRVVFGGDWPVVLGASSYTRWVETLRACTTSLTETAQQKLWSENARRLYRLQGA